ncbi:uncharacterized protein LOC123535853 [Mercenaria mercenaria]|uniref:uncharacterized protein LOC123535853 n=1 Tax=Mercenaria mercenaria TaxID=6596 RepID=UPI00234F229E|nr:uncharacterized protein LOC123535853 [Mercenaria mercenaria]
MAAEATGVGMTTVRKIRKESFSGEGRNEENLDPLPASSSEKVKTNRIVPDDFDCGVIRRKIREFYVMRKQLPTVGKIHKELASDIGFHGSITSLRKILKNLGYRWKKCGSNRKVLMEKPDVSRLRCEYVRKVKQYRDSGYDLVYLDETWIDTSHTAKYCWQSVEERGVAAPFNKGQRLIVVHAGGQNGFVPGAELVFKANCATGDYHHEMNGPNFEKWLKEKLLPSLRVKCVIIMDNASYHSVQSEKTPSSSTRKADIQEWLRNRDIPFGEKLTRPELLNIVKIYKPKEKVYRIDSLIKERGHEVLRLPPYHCEFNPIELIWANLKKKVGQRNLTFKLTDVQTLTHSALADIGITDWENAVSHVLAIEENYRQTELLVDDQIDQFVIPLSDESATDTASEFDSD